MGAIEAAPNGNVSVSLGPHEVELLRGLLTEMRLLLEADIPRSDQVMQRLFPDAYDTAEEANAYRELVDDDLRSAKLAALNDVSESLGPTITLTLDQASGWLTLLTDMRLAIGTRLDVTEETMATEVESDDPDAPAYSVLHWLGWMQEMMLRAMDAST
jgi:hypothetical protein